MIEESCLKVMTWECQSYSARPIIECLGKEKGEQWMITNKIIYKSWK